MKLPDNKIDYYLQASDEFRVFEDDFGGDPIYWVCNYCSQPVHQDELYEHITGCPEACQCNECIHPSLKIMFCQHDECECCYEPATEQEIEKIQTRRAFIDIPESQRYEFIEDLLNMENKEAIWYDDDIVYIMADPTTLWELPIVSSEQLEIDNKFYIAEEDCIRYNELNYRGELYWCIEHQRFEVIERD